MALKKFPNGAALSLMIRYIFYYAIHFYLTCFQNFFINCILQVSAIKKKLHVKGYYDNDNDDKKYLEIDKNLNKLNRKIKDGNILDQGQRGANKVSAMAAHLSTINKQPEQPLFQRSVSNIFYVLDHCKVTEILFIVFD